VLNHLFCEALAIGQDTWEVAGEVPYVATEDKVALSSRVEAYSSQAAITASILFPLKRRVRLGPMAIREIARRVDRDVRAVHSDVHVVLNAGLVECTDDGRVHFVLSRAA
jgi:hypothetical protein